MDPEAVAVERRQVAAGPAARSARVADVRKRAVERRPFGSSLGRGGGGGVGGVLVQVQPLFGAEKLTARSPPALLAEATKRHDILCKNKRRFLVFDFGFERSNHEGSERPKVSHLKG